MNLNAELELAGIDLIAALPEAWAGALAVVSAGKPARSPAMNTTMGRVRVIGLHGILTQRAGLLAALGFGTGLNQVATAIDDALDDDFIEAIVLDVDSPGGSVYGVQELAANIRQAREQKPVIAVANSLAASAAYWLASQASELYVTPGGEVGSIGVYTTHEDISQLLKKAGIHTTLISVGKYKVEGNPFGPLDAGAKAFMQSRVAKRLDQFHADVAKGRKTSAPNVASTYGQGRTLGADDALKAGMADGIQTLDQVLRRLSARQATARATTKSLTGRLNAARLDLLNMQAGKR